MRADFKVCDECACNCMLIHGWKHHSRAGPSVASFFKVMIGDRFSEALFVPPRFAGKFSSLLGKKTFLEDSTGRKWTVKLSSIDGSLAFQEGWHAFSSDHSIQVGDFLVFYYIMEHFIVHIFGKNGCQKFQYSEGAKSVQNKRAKFLEDSGNASGHCAPLKKEPVRKQQVVDSSSFQSKTYGVNNHLEEPLIAARHDTNRQTNDKRSRVYSTEYSFGGASDTDRVHDHFEEPLMAARHDSSHQTNNKRSRIFSTEYYPDEPDLMINRGLDCSGTDNRTSLFDLYDFEMSNSKLDVTQTNIIQSQGNGRPFAADTLMKDQLETGSIRGDPMIVQHEDASHDACNVEINGKDDDVMRVSTKDDNNASRTRPSMDHQINNYEVDKVLCKIKKNSCKNGQFQGDGATSASVDALKQREHRKEHGDVLSRCTRQSQIAEGKTLPQSTHLMTDESWASKEKHAVMENSSQLQKLLSVSSKNPLANGETRKIIKPEQVESVQYERLYGGPQTLGVYPLNKVITVRDRCKLMVKEEPVDSIDLSAPLAVEISCLVTTDSESFLELPTGLPSFPARGNHRLESRQEVVMLCDPALRLWPVYYHERHGFKVLTGGWAAFRKANNIKPGDSLCFSPQYESDGIYIVQIIRNT